ncbi:MAG: ABC transporter permease subunit [Clostridia bacterium]|nr:ABC transporter permease subunit [Clostridia bacterium]MBQ6937377.1 ABC transporter permease subunit [Clostridia bacterium]MBR2885164.1 ABC transporter permease subunit [Clostridia bacterium]
MKAIFKKEFKNYFLSPVGYIFVGVFMALASMFFASGILSTQQADISLMFSDINVIYLFLASLLTMRLLAEEKNKKTDQLLLSSPVSITEIVLGKYFAAMAVFGVTILLSFIFPAIMFAFGEPSLSEVIGSYIGFVLLWGAFISIGVFISSLTESQMIAGVFTFASLLLIYFISWFEASVQNELAKKVIDCFSLLSRYSEFQSGILNIENIIYYLSFIFVFLFLTVRVIDKRRYS